MNDNDFQRQLRRLTTPEASEAARERARHRALVAFNQGGSRPPENFRYHALVWSWRGGVALVTLLGIVSVLFFHHHDNPENVANDRELLHQMETLFPHQLNAVVENNGKTDLSIADAPLVGSDQPVLLVFRRGRDTIRVLSYSGHRVCLELGHEHSCFEVLETTGGGVILEGEDRAWVASQHPVIDGYAVRAQTLEASL